MPRRPAKAGGPAPDPPGQNLTPPRTAIGWPASRCEKRCAAACQPSGWFLRPRGGAQGSRTETRESRADQARMEKHPACSRSRIGRTGKNRLVSPTRPTTLTSPTRLPDMNPPTSLNSLTGLARPTCLKGLTNPTISTHLTNRAASRALDLLSRASAGSSLHPGLPGVAQTIKNSSSPARFSAAFISPETSLMDPLFHPPLQHPNQIP